MLGQNKHNVITQTKDTIEHFNITQSSPDSSEIYDSLCKLRPDKIGFQNIIKLIKYVEIKASTNLSSHIHYNTFGTGGDDFKTINISTIASIVASNFVNIYKVGTKAVTSKWGSTDFFGSLTANIHLFPPLIRNKAYYQEGSGYISLGDLGYIYSASLKQARIQLYQDGIPDIYKVIFPASNLTCSLGQVNGVYSSKYIGFFVDSAIELQRNAIILHSYRGVDELISGQNLVIRVTNQKLSEREIYLPSTVLDSSYDDFIAESADILNNVSKFIDILTGNCPRDVITTIAYNAACILNLESEEILIEYFAEKILEYMPFWGTSKAIGQAA